MPDDQNPVTTPDEDRNLVIRPSMTDDKIREALCRADFAEQELIREDFSCLPARKQTLESFKSYLNGLYQTSNGQFRPRFERLRTEVVNEIASRLMPGGYAFTSYFQTL